MGVSNYTIEEEKAMYSGSLFLFFNLFEYLAGGEL